MHAGRAELAWRAGHDVDLTHALWRVAGCGLCASQLTLVCFVVP